MRKNTKILLQYKYPNEPWITYDWTLVPKWADEVYKGMKTAHPTAQHQMVTKH